MQKTIPQPKKHTLPVWAGWLTGYAAVLLAAAGLVYFWRVAFFLDNHLSPLAPTLGVMGVFSLLYLAVFLLHRFAGDVCKRGAALVFLCGLLFCFATAPLQAPDEGKHFLRANAISRGQFSYNYNYAYPEDVHLLMERFEPAMAHGVEYQGGALAPGRVESYLDTVESGAPAASEAEAPVMFLLLPFLHQGLFMAGARLVGFSALGQMYAGRIANLLLYTLLCYFALKNAQRYRTVLLAVCLLPISLFMGASCSYDGMMLALCYFLCSFFCKAQFTQRDLGLFLAALALATYIKPNNAVLALVLLLIPKSRWKVRFDAKLVVLAVAALALVFWWGAGFIDGSVLKTGYPALERGSGEAAGPGEQMAFILRNPMRFLATAFLSIYEADGFLFDLGRFGWMDLAVPLVGGLSVLGLCLSAWLGAPGKTEDRRGAVIGLCLMGLLYAAAVLGAMYVLDTDVASIRITGQQPRYFLPAFLLLLLAGCIGASHIVRPRLDGGEAVQRRERVLLWVCAALALFAAVLVFQNYFVGQWLPKSEGGWKMVNLFGWQVV